jgi:ubiquinone/menaquinone biosynthesis C-methylase UbiE
MVNLDDQYRCPMGSRGKLAAEVMNIQHEALTLWGLSHVTVGSDFAILDVGCGGGKTISRLARLAPQGKVYGIDYSIDMVRFSKIINEDLISQNCVEIIAGSVEKMSFRDDLFNLVTAFETYYFWNNFPNSLKEINRVMKHGGKLLLVNELMYGVTSSKLIKVTHVKLLPLKEILNILLSVGFVNVQVFTETESAWNAFLAQK